MRIGTDRLDDSLIARRRMVEIAALVCRCIGIAVVLCTALGVRGFAAESVPGPVLYLCAALMALSSVMSGFSARHPASPRYAMLSALQIALDTAVTIGCVVFTERHTGANTWPVLSLPIAIAAIRHQLPGALAVWAVTSASLLLMPLDPGAAALGVSLNLMIAGISGSQASAFQRQLSTLQEVRRELQHQATHDALTGLPNRAHLAASAEHDPGRPLAVLLLDLNGFKQINDTHGHAAGDVLLHEVGNRLGTVLGPGDLAARLGGDEFVVLLRDADAATAGRTAQRIRSVIAQPVGIGPDRAVRVGVSVGVAIRPAGDGAGLDALIADADAAMYREKHAGRAA
ncbi:yneF-like uncharacterized protein [Actinoplanes sp. SE50/110]|uniref:GGDEF domain-containing protein n=1 Tax=unclassified Actinoplanes TaxID=2626549 RepID=UPI00023ED5BA|nr:MULTISPECIES: GGDEF domain-containing protein [unclassified Actinoplanes]AEV83393.1 yneF-like uncharacterized protein [Actinoplanes sp. SE50/110]SLL99194.1 hypothetical protein ACSP50_2425 [Actinoplanes sp. SE50/110]